jgi:flagellar biosynthetic protein FliQ
MSQSELVLRALREGLLLALLISAPPLLASLVVGFVTSILQAATQVQEQTLSFVPKVIAVFAALALTAPWIGAEMVRFGRALLALIPAVGG